MTSKLSILTIGFAAFFLAGSPVWACPSSPPPGSMLPGFIRLAELEGSIILEIDDFTALGSEAGDSCGAAPILPEGLAPTSISVVHAQTGEPVGFGPFRADARARRGFCGQGSTNCVAFVSKVTQQVKAGTPLKMIIEVLSEDVLDARRVTNLAVRVARSSVFVVGGVDNDGLPHHHLSVFRPSSIEIVLAKKY